MKYLLLAALSISLLATAISCTGTLSVSGPAVTAPTSTPTPSPTPTPAFVSVYYTVTGDGTLASAGYDTPAGSVGSTINLPWTSPTYTLASGSADALVAIYDGPGTTITVSIYVNGSLWMTSTGPASGDNYVTVSGILP